ncbi:MAG: tyrosine-type recombinase/integrase, partial [bacterium]|nr:tyrosine-type recombinase/integrase [bacterium]
MVMTEAQKYLTEYLNYLEIEKNRSIKTRENYERYLKVFFDEEKINKVYDITEESVRNFRLFLARRPVRSRASKTTVDAKGDASNGLKKNTQSYYIIAIRNFLKFLAKRDLKVLSPDKIELPRTPSRQIEIPESADIERLLNAPDTKTLRGLRDKAILETFFSTGLRISELCAMSRYINLERGEISVRGKGEKIRVVFFAPSALTAIKNYLAKRTDADEALFISFAAGNPVKSLRDHGTSPVKSRGDNGASLRKLNEKVTGRINPRTVQRMVDHYARKAGIQDHVTPHMLRHCLHPETLIFLPHRIISAENLYKTSSQIMSFNFSTLKLLNNKMVGKEMHVTDNLLSIWADGYEISCTPNHRLFTLTETGINEIFARDLKVGDFIAGIKKIRVDGHTKLERHKFRKLNKNIWRFLGYVIGDGTVSKRRRGVFVVDKNIENLKFYQKILKQEFNYDAKIVKGRNSNSFILNFYSNEFVDFLIGIGFTTIKNQKRVPPLIFKASKEELKEFIAGLYDAEGNNGKGGIRIFSSSKFLLKEVQMLFLTLGIDTHLYRRDRNVTLPISKKVIWNTIYHLQIIHRPDQIFFKHNIKTLKDISTSIHLEYDGEKLPIRPILKKIYSDINKKWKVL